MLINNVSKKEKGGKFAGKVPVIPTRMTFPREKATPISAGRERKRRSLAEQGGPSLAPSGGAQSTQEETVIRETFTSRNGES